MEKKRGLMVLLVVAAMALPFTSCEKDDAPDYVGTWLNEESGVFFGETMTVRTTLILSESAFEMQMGMVLADVEIAASGIKGDLMVSGETFTISPTAAGSADLTSGVMTWINKGEPGWEDALEEMEFTGEESATYSVDGDKMTIKFVGEDDDPLVFSRQ